MKTSFQLLLFLARPLLAHSNLGHAEICGLGAPLIPPGGPVCLADPRYLACADGGCGYRLRQHAWTHASPCLKGNESVQQICVFTDTTFAEGRGISLVTTPQRANYLATTPAIAEPDMVQGINQDLNRSVPAKYEIREIPGKGMGLIATAHIHRGDLIMANTASLMIDYRAFSELTKPQYTTLQLHAVSNLPLPHRTLLLNLSSHTHSPQDLSPAELVDTIAATNAFDIDPDEDDADQDHSFFVVFPEIARMNHDCRPNSDYLFDHSTLAQYVRATRDIQPGEELTLSYINSFLTRPQRRRKLKKNWGFDCSCPACTLDGARADESDSRLGQIAWAKGELRDWGPASRACPEMAELLVALYEMERLWGSMYEAYTLAALEYSAAGNTWAAVKYARLGIEWAIPMTGEDDEDVGELRKLSEDPSAHWSWRRRVRREEEGERRTDDDDDDHDDADKGQKGEEGGRGTERVEENVKGDDKADQVPFGSGTIQEILQRNLDKVLKS